MLSSINKPMVDKELEEEIKVIGLTKYLINLPSPKLTVFLILAVSFIASLLGYCAMLGVLILLPSFRISCF